MAIAPLGVPADPPAPGSSPRYELLGPMRAIATIAVIVFHAAGVRGHALLPQNGGARYVGRLDGAIAMFFMISGFVIYRPWAAALFGGRDSPAVGVYAWRRLLRVIPAYWVALTLGVLLVPFTGVITPTGIPTYYGFAQIYRESTIGGGLGVAWTLCVEMTFYAFVPLWAFAMRGVARRARRSTTTCELAGVAGLIVLSSLYVVVLVGRYAPGDVVPATHTGLSWLPAWLHQLAFGMGLAVLTVRYPDPRRAPAFIRVAAYRPWVYWLAALAIFVASANWPPLEASAAPPFGHGEYIARDFTITVVALLLVTPALFAPERGRFGRLLSNRVLVSIGVVSYACYLFHDIAFALLDDMKLGVYTHNSPVAWAAATLLLTFAMANLSYYLVERPTLKLRSHVPSLSAVRRLARRGGG